MTTQLLVRKDALHTTQIATTADVPLQEGQIRVRVDKFSFTANNITYAAFGDAMQYWQFFPSGQDGWGNIPVWGFGNVVQSSHPGVAVGERLYGYWPFATHAVLSPAKLTEGSFMDAAEHRRALHPVYNQYMRSSADPFYSQTTEDLQALLRPLFTTSYLIDDFFADNDFFGAKTAILSSASSKTAYGTAHHMHMRSGLQVIGLTSERNRAFCESLGCYHRVISYEQLGEVAADTPVVYVDFAGNADLRRAIHTRFTQLAYSCSIGGTHVQQLGSGKDLPGPKATLFFAPAQIVKRRTDLGPAQFAANLVNAWHAFVQRAASGSPPWLQVVHHHGAPAAQQVYAQVLAGDADARTGHMVSLHNA
ncbi:MAG: hypothetical protein RL682_669 [Pseudomonadota bacterium]|jgi:hypothetical protein